MARSLILAGIVGLAEAGWCVRPQPERCIVDQSEGPKDADVEIKLYGLPPTTSTDAVFLNFWAARKSPRTYDPLKSLVNCSVYENTHVAYPNYDDADFNGGNVPVTSSGEATIRVRTPAAHMVWHWVSLPHIHMRLCNQSGAHALVMKFRPKLLFTGKDVWSYPMSDTFGVVSAHAYAAKDASKAPARSSQTVEPFTYINWASTDEEKVELKIVVPGEENQIKDGPKTTTTAPPTTTTTMAVRKVRDTDPLEFSPVYDCMLEGMFFDHFSAACVQGCNASFDAAHGQCVKKPVLTVAANYSAAWDLTMACGAGCWAEARTGTLHQLRLIVAGELKIPFQEVEVAVEPKTVSARRLEESPLRAFHMTVEVMSRRVTASAFAEQLQPFPHDAEALTTALGMKVGSIAHTNPLPTPKAESLMNDKVDPFVPAYDEAERKMRGGSPLDFLPAPVIIALAGVVAVLAAGFVTFMLCRRRRMRKQLEQQGQQQKKADEFIDAEKDAAEKAAAAESNGEAKRWI